MLPKPTSQRKDTDVEVKHLEPPLVLPQNLLPSLLALKRESWSLNVMMCLLGLMSIDVHQFIFVVGPIL